MTHFSFSPLRIWVLDVSVGRIRMQLNGSVEQERNQCVLTQIFKQPPFILTKKSAFQLSLLADSSGISSGPVNVFFKFQSASTFLLTDTPDDYSDVFQADLHTALGQAAQAPLWK